VKLYKREKTTTTFKFIQYILGYLIEERKQLLSLLIFTSKHMQTRINYVFEILI